MTLYQQNRYWGAKKNINESSCEWFFRYFKGKTRRAPGISPGALARGVSRQLNGVKFDFVQPTGRNRLRRTYEDQSIGAQVRALEHIFASSSFTQDTQQEHTTHQVDTTQQATAAALLESFDATTMSSDQSNCRVRPFQDLNQLQQRINEGFPVLSFWRMIGNESAACRFFAEILTPTGTSKENKILRVVELEIDAMATSVVLSNNPSFPCWFVLQARHEHEALIDTTKPEYSGMVPTYALAHPGQSTDGRQRYYLFGLDGLHKMSNGKWCT